MGHCMANQEIAARLLADLKRDFGLTDAQAAGVVGNLMHESGGFESLQEINPTVPGSRGGFGYAQWTGPRRKAFEAYVQANNLDPTSYEANYGFLQHEVTNDPYERGQFLKVRNAKTAAEAAEIISNEYLRPGIPHMASRTKFANDLVGQAGAQSAPAPTGNALGRPNALSAASLPSSNAVAGLQTRAAPMWMGPPPVTFEPLTLPSRRRA